MLSPEIITQLEKTLKKDSIRRYKTWARIVSPDEYKISNFVNFHKKITTDFSKRPDFTSILSVIIKVLNLEGKNTDIYQKLREEAFAEKPLIAPPIVKTNDNHITVDEIEKKQQSLEKKTDRTKQDDYELQFLIMINELAPMRTQDYINVGFSPDTPNYVDMDNRRIIYTEGKSLNSNRVIDIPDKLFNVIKSNKEKYKADFLFIDMKKDKAITAPMFNKMIKNIFGKPITSQLLRQIYVSHFSNSQMPRKERLRKAQMMAHTLHTADTNYTRFSSKIDEQSDEIAKLRAEVAELRELLKKKIETN